MQASCAAEAPRSWRSSSGRCRGPGAGEVLIRVAAAGVNRPDVLQRRGPLSAAAGRARHPRAGNRGRGRRGGRGRGRAGRPEGLRAGRRRRLCRILRRAGRAMPARARRAVAGRSGGDARDAVHRVDQRVRARLRGRRREGAGPRRHERHRHDGDRARQAVRAEGRSSPAAATRNARRALELGAAARSTTATQDFVEEVAKADRRRGRRRRPRHGRRRLCAAQPRMPRRGGPARVDRRPARRRRPRSRSSTSCGGG